MITSLFSRGVGLPKRPHLIVIIQRRKVPLHPSGFRITRHGPSSRRWVRKRIFYYRPVSFPFPSISFPLFFHTPIPLTRVVTTHLSVAAAPDAARSHSPLYTLIPTTIPSLE